jgi:hypothetical protein
MLSNGILRELVPVVASAPFLCYQVGILAILKSHFQEAGSEGMRLQLRAVVFKEGILGVVQKT